ncbi:Alpha-enolase-like protein, partial [Daphnia magna]
RDQHEDPEGRHRQGHRQLDPHQDQPDRHAVGNLRRHRDGQARRLHRRDLAPLGRNRRLDHLRHRRRPERRPDQDRLAVALGPHGQVQPAAAHRGRPGRCGRLPRPRCLLQPEVMRAATRS